MSCDYTGVERYQLYTEKEGKYTLVGDAESAFSLMNDQLDLNKPVIVGVDYRTNSSNSDGTDHFMIVNGRGYDHAKQQYYFTYIETGRTKDAIHEATSDKNRLYYDKANGTFTGSKHWSSKNPTPIYNILQIRTLK